TGTAVATDATVGFLYIPTSAGAQTGTPVADTTGTSPIVYDTTNNRLYVYNPTGTPAWKYIAITGGFQIPDYETADPISGEKLKEGDIVLGRIDETMADDALHATWVSWKSVKKQLLAEARGELSRSGAWGTGTVEGVGTETFLDKVTNVLFSLGISVKDRLVSIANLAVNRFTAQNATIITANIQKLEMVDSATGDIYCAWIANGEWQKVKGECGSAAAEKSQSPNQNSEKISNDQPANAQNTAGENATPPAGGADNTTDEPAETEQQVGSNDVFAAQQIIEQAQQAANNALETSENAQQAIEERAQEVVDQAAKTADKAAKQAIKEVKEQIKQEVKEELENEKSQSSNQNSEKIPNDQNSNDENGTVGEQLVTEQVTEQVAEQPKPEPAPVLELIPPIQELIAPIGDIIQESAAGLMNAAGKAGEFIVKIMGFVAKQATWLAGWFKGLWWFIFEK
ncbi:MAG: hypothetical protein ABIJ84_02025, partial [bacterium]